MIQALAVAAGGRCPIVAVFGPGQTWL